MAVRKLGTARRVRRSAWTVLAAAAVATAPAGVARAGYEVPNPAYAPPTHYYDAATGTGFALRTSLHNIVSSGFVARSYGDSRYAMSNGDVSGSPSTGGGEDLDPNNSSNILLAYNRASVLGKWDSNSSTLIWNREHVWPKYWLNVTSSTVTNTYKGPASDAFELRPADADINSGRGDSWYGYFPNPGGNGSPAPTSGEISTVTNYGGNTAGGVTYWYPGGQDIGDMSRALFYMATRYFDPTDTSRTKLSINNLELVNGPPPVDTGSGVPRYKMGDLNSLLHWNYQDGVDNFERRRNQQIYGSAGDLTNHALNPTYYQGNRNPFVDHPEYVWAVFGGGNNNSQIYVGSGADADGSSSVTVDLGHVIKGAAMPTGSTSVFKTGANPTTFDVTASGVTTAAGSAVPIGTGQPMDYNSVTKSIGLTLSASTASVGVKAGSVTINNTDLTSSGAGHGSTDGDDTINVTATVVDHAQGSFVGNSTGWLDVDFGYVPLNFATRSMPFAITNVPAASGYTADLALPTISSGGHTARLYTDVATFTNLAAGAQNNYSAFLDPSVAGNFVSQYVFQTADEAIPGATNSSTLSMALSANVISSATFPTTGFIQLNAGETYATGPFSIAGGVTLTKTGPGAMNVDGAQSNGANSALVVTAGAVTMSSDAGAIGARRLAVSVSNAGSSVTFASTQHLASLSIGAGTTATVSPGGANLLVTSALSITGGGTLDLGDNAAVIGGATPDAVRGLLLSGNAGGTWSGTGIASSIAAAGARHVTGIGYAPAPLVGGVFAGEPLAAEDVVLKYTWYGDANLDGALDADDFSLIDKGMAGGGDGWTFGDFNYDGVVDVNDYLLLDTAYGVEAGTLAPSLLADREARFGDAYVAALIAAVPEPASIAGVLLLAVGSLLQRMPRRHS